MSQEQRQVNRAWFLLSCLLLLLFVVFILYWLSFQFFAVSLVTSAVGLIPVCRLLHHTGNQYKHR